jgi:YegS/Rv2252/BmrU family lipid kinase
MKHTMIIFNPTAGQAEAPERDLATAAEVWRAQGWLVELQPTHAAGDATRLSREAAHKKYDLVVAAGGDGTINEVINGLAGSETAMATLPLGTMNVWARELGLPLHPPAAARAMLEWHARPIDLGRAAGRYFLLMAGVGVDAAITANVRPRVKRHLGMLAYVLSAIEHMARIRGTRTRLLLDGKSIKGRVLLVVLGNSQLYGGVVKITHRATIDDGLLDVCVIKGDNFLSALSHLVAIFLRRYTHSPEIEYYRARTVKITSRSTLPVQVDGDTIGHTPITIEAVPGALRALMPERPPNNLVRHQALPAHIRTTSPKHTLS